ncbi:hypothetical protein [Candidatus Nitrospira nitrificans]|nr:hypothetical protein [Candidatus Nitrospira nitrificans]
MLPSISTNGGIGRTVIGTAMVCSSRPESMGIRFLELVRDDKDRLSQVILSLLMGQSANLQLFS